MERLSDKAIEIINTLHTERLDYDSEYLPLIDCAQRCAAYEDTCLDPEELAQQRFLIAAQKDPKKLARLRDIVLADEADRLVILPCKVGDTIYVIPSSENYALNLVNRQEENNRVYKQIVSKISFFKDDYLLTTCDGICSALGQFFGDNWFLSRKEAEVKLSCLWEKHKHLTRQAAEEALREGFENA